MSQFLPLTVTLAAGATVYSPMMNARDESFWRNNSVIIPSLRPTIRLFNEPGKAKATQDKVRLQMVFPVANTTDDTIPVDYSTVNVNFSLSKNADAVTRQMLLDAVKDLVSETQVSDLVLTGSQPY